jgi:hypothetical protein
MPDQSIASTHVGVIEILVFAAATMIGSLSGEPELVQPRYAFHPISDVATPTKSKAGAEATNFLPGFHPSQKG